MECEVFIVKLHAEKVPYFLPHDIYSPKGEKCQSPNRSKLRIITLFDWKYIRDFEFSIVIINFSV